MLAGLGGHRGADPDPGAGDLPLGLVSQRQHRLLVILIGEVDPAAHLRHPQPDAVMLKQRCHRGVLAAVKGPLILPDHNRVPPAIGIGERGDQGRGLRAARPGQRAALPDVEEGSHDPAVPGHQRSRLRLLPRQGCHRILMIFRGHPAVESEPQTAALMPCCPSAPGPLRPRRQRIPALPCRLTFQATPAASLTAHRPTLQVQTRHRQGQTSQQ